jgi:TRAP-type mannitol/chloroaromatic compound transport system permease small subunit
MHPLVAFVTIHDRVQGAIARGAAWLMLVLVFVITFDVVTRKFNLSIPGIGSTKLQDLEWFLHATIFVFWFGYGYIINAHVRVDVLTQDLDLRRKCWLDLIGCFLFALPFSYLLARDGIRNAYVAWQILEGPESGTGLGYRYIIKTLFAIGLSLLFVSVLAMIVRLATHLFLSHRIGKVPLPYKTGDTPFRP